MLANKKTVVITGGQGVGKSLLARVIAAGYGPSVATTTMEQLSAPFGMASILDRLIPPDAVVVEGVRPTIANVGLMRSLVSNPKIWVTRMHKSSLDVRTPNFIFVVQSAEHAQVLRDDRQFMVVEVRGGE